MAKSQKRHGREPKKPKTAVKKVAPATSIFDDIRQDAKKKPSPAPVSTGRL